LGAFEARHRGRFGGPMRSDNLAGKDGQPIISDCGDHRAAPLST
jgi:hypothetical protein